MGSECFEISWPSWYDWSQNKIEPARGSKKVQMAHGIKCVGIDRWDAGKQRLVKHVAKEMLVPHVAPELLPLPVRKTPVRPPGKSSGPCPQSELHLNCFQAPANNIFFVRTVLAYPAHWAGKWGGGLPVIRCCAIQIYALALTLGVKQMCYVGIWVTQIDLS